MEAAFLYEYFQSINMYLCIGQRIDIVTQNLLVHLSNNNKKTECTLFKSPLIGPVQSWTDLGLG